MTDTQTLEILKTLRALPSEKAEEVKDFAIFLKERYGKPDVIDESDEWFDEDYLDASLASMTQSYIELEEGE
jgi:hypothetical protein